MSETTTCFILCKFCGSKNVVKNGKKGQVQYYLCRNCGRAFAGNNAMPGMRFPPEQIATAVNLFYDGLSIDKIRRQLDALYHVYPSDSTVYDWAMRYSRLAVEEVNKAKIHVGDSWIADETMLKLDRDVDVWLWDLIDEKTRYLLASHLSRTRTTQDAKTLMKRAHDAAGHAPKVIYTDKLRAYLDGIEVVFGAETKHIQGGPFNVASNTNLIERFHSTLKSRTSVMRGLHTVETARPFVDGWLVHYNYFRPHEALRNRTPGEAAKSGFKRQGWLDVVKGDGLSSRTCEEVRA